MVSRIHEIYAAAARLFSRHGFNGVTMRDVAEGAGMTLAALYYHFQSKEELYDEVSQFQFETFLEKIKRQWQALPIREKIPSRLMANILDEVLLDSTFFFMIQRDLHSVDSEKFASRSRQRYAALLSLLEQAVKCTCKAKEADTYAVTLAALIAGYCEFMHADDRFRGEEREALLKRHRETMILVVQKSFEESFLPKNLRTTAQIRGQPASANCTAAGKANRTFPA